MPNQVRLNAQVNKSNTSNSSQADHSIDQTSHIRQNNPSAIFQRAQQNPESLSNMDIIQLQQTIGNRAVLQLFKGQNYSHNLNQQPIQMEATDEQKKVLEDKMKNFTNAEQAGSTVYYIMKHRDEVKDAKKFNNYIEKWISKGMDDKPEEMNAINSIFDIKEPQDAQRHKDVLVSAYEKLAGSNTKVGRELAALLVQPTNYTVTLKDKLQKEHQKEVKLNLIVAPGIPSQFVSPWDSGKDVSAIIQSKNPLEATIMWDPIKHFEYYKPRTAKDISKAENDQTRRGTLGVMEPWVGLAHELGHFHDFLNKPMEYYQTFSKDDGDEERERMNLGREKAIMIHDFRRHPRTYYHDHKSGANAEFLGKE